jgi:hypothetical protein
MNRREFVKRTAMAGAGLALFRGFEDKAWALRKVPFCGNSFLPFLG